MSDEEILDAYCNQAPSARLDFDLVGYDVLGDGNVALVTPDTVAKGTLDTDTELSSRELVRQNASIHVPLGIRCAQGFLIQEFVPGHRLSHAWPAISCWQRFRVLITMCFYI
jgi:hypothetical protein